MKILHTADWHFDVGNLDYTAAAAHRAIENVGDVDVAVIAGDVAVHRGSINPHVAYEIRRAIQAAAARARLGALVLTGNHDQSFHVARVGTVRGLLETQVADGVETFEAPEVSVCTDADGCVVAFVMVPTPNKYWMRAAGLEDERDAQEAVESTIRGMIAEAREGGADRVVVVYHGTVAGCMAGDERVMVTGMDVAVRRDCFAGADAVMLGHIHKRQDWPATPALPAMAYCGSIAPLTWNDRALEPAVYVWNVTREGVTYEAVPLPVVSQMVDLAAEVPEDVAAPDALQDAMFRCAAIHPGARVRVRLRGPRAVLSTVTKKREDGIREHFSLRSLTVIPEPTDDGLVRMDLGAGWTMEQALVRFMAYHDTPEALQAKVLDFAREIERQVADAHLDARYDFRPRRVEGVNWCQYGSFDVNLADAGVVVAVAGSNYSGKSNFARALAFAVYKQQLAGNRLSALVRKGQREAFVAVEFESNGATYRVRRTLKVDNQGAATSDVDFLRLDGAGWVPVNEGTSQKTQAAIEALVGPWEYFEATTWAGQNAIDKVLDLTPAGMKDRLMTLLHRNFEDRVRMASNELAKIVAERDQAEAQRAAQVRILEANQAGDALAVDEAEQVVALLTTNIENMGGALADAQARLEEARDAAAEMRAAVGIVRAAEQAESEARAKKDLAVRAAIPADEIRARIAELEQLMADGDAAGHDVAAATEAVEATAAAEAGAREKLAEVQARARESAEGIGRLVTEVTQKIAAADRDSADARRELAQAKKQAAIKQSVPCEGRTFTQERDDGPGRERYATEFVTAGCRFLLDAIAAEKMVPVLETRVTELDERLARLVDERNGHLDLQRTSLEQFTQEIGVATEAAASATLAAADRRKELAKVSASASMRRSQERLLADERAQLVAADAAAELLATAAREHAETLSKLLAAREAAAGAPAAEQLLAIRSASLEDLKRQERGAREQLGAAEIRVAQLKAKAEVMATARAEADRLQAELTRLAGLEAVVKFYREAMHRDGLPFLLLEAFAIPALQRLVNEYLADTAFSVQVTSERELASGELRNAVYVTFTDHRGTHHASSASGYQRTAIGMAFMAAQADLSAEATGSRVWFAIQDEGFGTMDPENLEGAKRTIRRIGAHRGHFLFISHVPGMTEAADTVLAVTDAGGTSTIEIER